MPNPAMHRTCEKNRAGPVILNVGRPRTVMPHSGERTLPFESYPERGRALLGAIRGSNCRKGYGLKLMKITGQTCCAYCGMSLVEPYTNWLQMAVDHVVPQSVGRGFALSAEWIHDASNCDLSCAACNGFGNRYRPPEATLCPTTLEEFWQLRDRIFTERWAIIRDKHAEERRFFDSTPWRIGANRTEP